MRALFVVLPLLVAPTLAFAHIGEGSKEADFTKLQLQSCQMAETPSIVCPMASRSEPMGLTGTVAAPRRPPVITHRYSHR